MKVNINDSSFYVDPKKLDFYWKDISNGKWEPESFVIIDTFLRPENIMIDMGCWIGPLTLYAASKGISVHSIDPDHVAIKDLKENIALNSHLNNISVYELGISDNDGIEALYARTNFGYSSSSLLNRTRDRLSVSIPTTTFNKFIENNGINKIDFIKIDIEGGEWKVLPSISETLRNLKFPTLYISFHFDYLLQHFIYRAFKIKILGILLFKYFKPIIVLLFHKKIERTITGVLDALNEYENIYNLNGQLLKKANVKKMKLLRKDTSLVFTNKIWKI